MHDEDGGSLTRRLHWEGDAETSAGAKPRADAETPADTDAPFDEDGPLAAFAAPAPLRPERAYRESIAPPRSFERRELDRIDDEALDRRRVLWRDTAVILVGVVAALLVGQVLLPRAGDIARASPTPFSTSVVIGPVGSVVPSPSSQASPGPSLGNGASAAPTPPPTEPPTGTAAPVATPRSTPRPTPRPPTPPPPTQPPPTEPPPTPEATPTPAPPTAAFTWSQSVPLTISFSNASSGGTEWLWDFGDGSTSAVRDPEHAYLSPGDYTVRLTVTGPGGSDVVEHTVTVSLT